MGLEGAVKLGYRKELEAGERSRRTARSVRQDGGGGAYARGKALKHPRPYFEVDEVIDPADSRKWVVTGLLGAERRPGHARKRRPHIDTW